MTEEKRQRQRHAPHCPQFTRAQGVYRQNLCQPIKLDLERYRRAPCRPASAGYIKGEKSAEAIRARFWLG